VAAPILTDWSATRSEVIETADHFLVGHTRHVAQAVTAWLVETIAGSPSGPSSA
jgi:alpha/beta superfamily hydrolase